MKRKNKYILLYKEHSLETNVYITSYLMNDFVIKYHVININYIILNYDFRHKNVVESRNY